MQIEGHVDEEDLDEILAAGEDENGSGLGDEYDAAFGDGADLAADMGDAELAADLGDEDEMMA